jgi:hypothetical protein
LEVCPFVREESGGVSERWGREGGDGHFAGAGVYVHEGVDDVC